MIGAAVLAFIFCNCTDFFIRPKPLKVLKQHKKTACKAVFFF